MDFYKVPIGFGMSLAINPPALNAYSAMTEEQKQAILSKAHNAKSKKKCTTLSTTSQQTNTKNLCHRFITESVAIFMKDGDKSFCTKVDSIISCYQLIPQFSQT